MKKALLIPIYQPSESVPSFLSQFKEGEFDDFLVVDDGSGEDYQKIFEQIRTNTVFRVLSYSKNKGKGGALKTGFRELLKEKENLDYIFTCDGDGQHAHDDVIALASLTEPSKDALLLGVRDFSEVGVPRRSRFGNRFSCLYFRFATGKKVKDTQTGLRGIPKSLFEIALETRGDRYDFEMNFLLSASRLNPLVEFPIKTIYEENNKSTHFKTVSDSLRIYRSPLLYLLVALVCFGVDIGFFHLLSNFAFLENMEQKTMLSTLVARVISGIVNFTLLNVVVFPSKGGLGKKAVRYTILWAMNLFLSGGLVYLFSIAPIGLTPLKVIIDVLISIANYFANLALVFAKKRRRTGHEG